MRINTTPVTSTPRGVVYKLAKILPVLIRDVEALPVFERDPDTPLDDEFSLWDDAWCGLMDAIDAVERIVEWYSEGENRDGPDDGEPGPDDLDRWESDGGNGHVRGALEG